MRPEIDPRPTRFLKPGEIFMSNRPTKIVTILGSCVAVTFYHAGSKIGAMCHGFLPNGDCSSKNPNRYRYLNCAIRKLLGEFTRAGIGTNEIVAHILGGAELSTQGELKSKILSVGRKNIEMAFALLQSAGLVISAVDIGGRTPRKVIFYTDTGRVLLKKYQKKDWSISGE